MGKFVKGCLAVAAVFAVAGGILCCVGAACGASLRDASFGFGSYRGSLLSQIADSDNWDDEVKLEIGTETSSSTSSGTQIQKYTFAKADIKNLDISVQAGKLQIKETLGDEIKVTTRVKNGKVKCEKTDDLLVIEDEGTSHLTSRKVEIIVELPADMSLDTLDIDVAAGQVISEYERLIVKTANIHVDAGEAQLSYLTVSEELNASVDAGKIELEDGIYQDVILDCGVGEIEFDGRVDGDLNGTCGIGRLGIDLDNNIRDFNYRLDCGVGSIKLEDENYSGLSTEREIDNHAVQTMKLENGIGEIEVEFEY